VLVFLINSSRTQEKILQDKNGFLLWLLVVAASILIFFILLCYLALIKLVKVVTQTFLSIMEAFTFIKYNDLRKII